VGVGVVVVAAGADLVARGSRVVPWLPRLMGVDDCPPQAETSRVSNKKALKSRFFFIRILKGLLIED
jgi:hypothetical protein